MPPCALLVRAVTSFPMQKEMDFVISMAGMLQSPSTGLRAVTVASSGLALCTSLKTADSLVTLDTKAHTQWVFNQQFGRGIVNALSEGRNDVTANSKFIHKMFKDLW